MPHPCDNGTVSETKVLDIALLPGDGIGPDVVAEAVKVLRAVEAKLTGGTTIAATVVTNFGRPNAERQLLTVRLVDKKEGVKIGAVTLGAGK